MSRRKSIAVVGSAAAWPLAGQAQQTDGMRRVGVLINQYEGSVCSASAMAFAQALAGSGWIQGKNVGIDHRFAGNDPALLKADAAELLGLTPLRVKDDGIYF